MTDHRPTTPLAAVTVAVALAAAACAASGPEITRPSNSTTAAPQRPPHIDFQQGVSNGRPYRVTLDTAEGTPLGGTSHWTAHTARLAGEPDTTGDPAVIDAFNHASVIATQGLIDQARSEAAERVRWTYEVTPTVTFRPTAVSDLLVGVFYAVQGAHPVNYIATVVIDSRTAQPITLKSLFRDENQGLQRLSAQAKLIWPTVYGHGDPAPMPDEPGNQPREENFANWIPTATGMEIHFRDYQFGHGQPMITVPWTALADLLAPDMAALTH